MNYKDIPINSKVTAVSITGEEVTGDLFPYISDSKVVPMVGKQHLRLRTVSGSIVKPETIKKL